MLFEGVVRTKANSHRDRTSGILTYIEVPSLRALAHGPLTIRCIPNDGTEIERLSKGP